LLRVCIRTSLNPISSTLSKDRGLLCCCVRYVSLACLCLLCKLSCNAHSSPGNLDRLVGLPEPRADHAVAMSRFALACMQKMKVMVSQLEVTLGKITQACYQARASRAHLAPRLIPRRARHRRFDDSNRLAFWTR
jgi:hypothetical protein